MQWKLAVIDKLIIILPSSLSLQGVRLTRARRNSLLESNAAKIPEHEAYIYFRQVGQFFIIIFRRNTPNRCTISNPTTLPSTSRFTMGYHSQAGRWLSCALINRANSLHAPTFFPRWNEWSIDHAFIGHRLYSIIGVSRDELLSPSSNTKTVAPDHLSYDYADSSQARFSYVMFRHGSAIDRLAAGSGHRLPPSRVGITWFACSQRVENVSWFLCAVAFPESPERLAND